MTLLDHQLPRWMEGKEETEQQSAITRIAGLQTSGWCLGGGSETQPKSFVSPFNINLQVISTHQDVTKKERSFIATSLCWLVDLIISCVLINVVKTADHDFLNGLLHQGGFWEHSLTAHHQDVSSSILIVFPLPRPPEAFFG